MSSQTRTMKRTRSRQRQSLPRLALKPPPPLLPRRPRRRLFPRRLPTKISGVFDSLEIPSPKAKKQAQLYSFWKKDQAAKDAAPPPVRENKRKAEADAPAEDKEAVVPKKARQASPAAEAPREASAAPAEAVAADDVDASAGVEEAEQDSNKASTPSVNGSDETSGNGDAAVGTALTTPADELDKRLGDDVEEELAEVAAEEEV